MFGFTHQLRVSNAQGLNVTFQGYTLERFKSRYVDPQGGDRGPFSTHTKYTQVMNNDLMDLSQRAVQRALADSFIYARDAAAQAARYFAKRPGGIHRYADMAKIFRRHFKLADPGNEQRDEVERVFAATSQGLNGAVIVSDLFAAKDGQRGGGLVDGAEGQVAFSADEDVAYLRDIMAPENRDRSADVTRQHLARSADAQIFIAFANMKFWNVAQMARVILHEATHKFAFTGDYAYHSNDRDWNALTGANAVKNADSYAYGAVSVKASSALSPDKIRRVSNPLISMNELRLIVPSMRG